MPKAPDFWWRRGPTAGALALWPLSALWGLGATIRMRRAPAYRPPVPVICVGNLVVGGAGKTPTVIALARLARERGHRPGILARGYRGSVTGATLVDLARHNAVDVGDEALLLAAVAPTVASSDRVAGARRLVEEEVTLILMDDGFQDPTLARDVSLIVVDTAVGIGNGQMVPAGPLRAPLGLQMGQADALLLVGVGAAGEDVARAAKRQACPVLGATLGPVATKAWRERRILAFAGIGRPEKLFASLRDAGADVVQTRAFPDHHPFGQDDARGLLEVAAAEGLRLVTTEKDHIRLKGGDGALAELRDAAEPFPVSLAFDDVSAVADLITTAEQCATERQSP